MNPPRPAPDALLKAARAEGRGRLKILLGAAPGVGKTVEMLREGADLLASGIDVVIGVVETHGRADTAALVGPFELLPRRAITRGAHTFHEFDLDAMLARHPQVALIDECAHTNAPGCRHAKRWQDIEELRDAGIDVMTTLNIQHVESLNDVIAGFTRVRVRETVPDACLEDAEIEVVDLPPDELIERLKAGKVYIPEEASRALVHFFSKSNLSALRELALRRAAQAVDRQMLDQLRASGTQGTFAGGERLVVAVGDQPGGEALVRTGKRLADALRAPWSVVTVETPRTAALASESRKHITAALDLATTLGATIATLPGRAVESALADYLIDTRATALVIGRSRRGWWFGLRHGSVVERLAGTVAGVALHVVPMGPSAPAPRSPARRQPWAGYGAGLLAVAGTTALAQLLHRWLGLNSVDLLYLMPVVGLATRFGQRAAVGTALAAALAYNFFFLPPLYTLTISDPQNIVTFLMLTVAGVVVSHLAGQLQQEARIGARSASENAAIAAFGQRLAAASDEASTTQVVIEEVAARFDLAVMVLRREGSDVRVIGSTAGDTRLPPIDRAAADWAFAHNTITGRASGTLTASDWQFHPLATALGVLAVLAVGRADAGAPVAPERRLLFATLKGQAALAYERIWLEADTRDLAALRQRDELRAALLSSIGHDLRTPLTAVVAAADELARRDPPSPALHVLVEETARLRRFFDDLIDMTRLEAGALDIAIEPVDLTDAAASAAHDLRRELGDRQLVLDIAPSLPLVEADPRLLHHVLINLIGNAARFAPPASQITLRATRTPDGLSLAVLDRGPGLPGGDYRRLFDRFTHGTGGDRHGGSGLGLAIVKGFADAMGITVAAADRPDGGAAFTLMWPEQRLRKIAEPKPAP